MQIPLTFHIYSIFNVRFKYFRFPIRHFDFRLNMHLIMHRAMLLSATVTPSSSKTNAATLNLLSFKGDLRPLIQWSPSLSHFHQTNHPYHLYFRWRNSTTGWTISKISTSFHQALVALEIRRSAMENSQGQLKYSRKSKAWCNFAPTPAVRSGLSELPCNTNYVQWCTRYTWQNAQSTWTNIVETVASSSSRSGLRSSTTNTYVTPRLCTKFRERALTYAGPTVWKQYQLTSLPKLVKLCLMNC